MSMSKEAWAEDFAAEFEENRAAELEFKFESGVHALVPRDETGSPELETVQDGMKAVQPKYIEVKGEKYPDLGNLTTKKVPHKNLIMDGVCTNCAHCGHELTDSVSFQRGIGPICSNKGYDEDPVEADETQALIDLAEYPELVEFLMEHYRPLGIRGLVNGLVRTASLNRPRGRNQAEGNAEVHAACCDAIESLGHRKLAALLRETLVVLEVRESKVHPGSVEVWVKRQEWTKGWSLDIKQYTWGSFFDRKQKAMIIPMHRGGDPKAVALTGRTGPDGRHVTNKRALWDLMLKHYGGRVAKVRGQAVKLVEKGK